MARDNILVVGDAMVDRYWHGIVRDNPEADAPCVRLLPNGVHRKERRFGGAANVAFGVLGLNMDVSLLSVVGPDHEGRWLTSKWLELCTRSMVHTDASRVTTTKTRLMSNGKQIARFDEETPKYLAHEIEDVIIDAMRRLVKTAKCVIVSDYKKGVVTNRIMSALFKFADVPVIVDPARHADWSRYRGASVIMPNSYELLETGSSGKEMAKRMSATIVEKLGERGMMIHTPDEYPPMVIPQHDVSVVDPCGAGDAAVATFAVAVASGRTFVDAATMANSLAAISVTKPGTSRVTESEMVGVARARYDENRESWGLWL